MLYSRTKSGMEGVKEMQAEGFTTFYRQHADFVYGIALSYLKQPQEAEDVTADVFVQLWETERHFPNDDEARAWLTVAVRNRCKNLLRRWGRRRREDESCLAQLPAAESNTLRNVMAALMELPERYRLPLLLFAVYGYSVHETAAILHLNESTVRTRVARARELIRKETGVDEA